MNGGSNEHALLFYFTSARAVLPKPKASKNWKKRLHAIDYELCWLKQLSKDYKNGVSRGAIAIAVGAMRYVKLLNPPRSTPDILELWCRTFNLDVMTILYREERPADDKFGFPDVFPKMFSPRGFLKSGCKTYEEFCTKSLVKIGEDHILEVPEGSPWAEWAKQDKSRLASVRILGCGYSERAKEKGHES